MLRTLAVLAFAIASSACLGESPTAPTKAPVTVTLVVPQPPVTPNPSSFVLSGYVFDATTKEPIANATPQFWGDSPTPTDALTDETGRYVLPLKFGGYWVFVWKDGCLELDGVLGIVQDATQDFYLDKEGA